MLRVSSVENTRQEPSRNCFDEYRQWGKPKQLPTETRHFQSTQKNHMSCPHSRHKTHRDFLEHRLQCTAACSQVRMSLLMFMEGKRTALEDRSGQFHKTSFADAGTEQGIRKKTIFSCKIIRIKLQNWLSLHLGELWGAPQGSSAPGLPQHEVPGSRSSGRAGKSSTAPLLCAARQPTETAGLSSECGHYFQPSGEM